MFVWDPQCLHNDLSLLRVNNCLTYPPLKFLESSHKEMIFNEVFAPSKLIMDHHDEVTPQRANTAPQVWEAWNRLGWTEMYNQFVEDLVSYARE